MLNALENLMVFKAVSYHEQSRSWRIKQRTWLTLFSLKQKSEFKGEASIHILLKYRLPKSSDFLVAVILITVKVKVQDIALGDLTSVLTPLLRTLSTLFSLVVS